MKKPGSGVVIHSTVLVLCSILIFISGNYKTGNWVTPVATVFLEVILAAIEVLLLVINLIRPASISKFWNAIIATILLLCVVLLTMNLINQCESAI